MVSLRAGLVWFGLVWFGLGWVGLVGLFDSWFGLSISILHRPTGVSCTHPAKPRLKQEQKLPQRRRRKAGSRIVKISNFGNSHTLSRIENSSGRGPCPPPAAPLVHWREETFSKVNSRVVAPWRRPALGQRSGLLS